MKFNYSLKIFFMVLFAAVTAFIGSCEDPTMPDDNFVKQEGILVDEQGFSIPAAIVEVVYNDKILASDTTDEDGYFALMQVPSVKDRLIMKVYHPDFIPYTANLKSLVDNSDNKENLKVKILHEEDCCGIINISVIDGNGNAIENADVKLRRNKELIRKGKTGSDGKITFENVCLNEYEVRIAKDGYAVVEDAITVEDCEEPLSKIYEMQQKKDEGDCCDGKITFYIKDADKNPLEKATVKLWKDGQLVSAAETNADGVAVFEKLCKGKYGISVEKDNYKTIEWNLELDCNKVLEIGKTLSKTECCDGVITFTVKDNNGNALAGAKIKILVKGTDKVISDPVTNSEGKAGVDGLCEGTYRVLILKDGYEAAEFDVEVKCHDKLAIEKNLKEKDCCKGVITVIVKDKDGNLLKGAKVKLWKDGKAVREVLTDDDGKAVMDGICEGKFGISIHHEDYKAIEYGFTVGCNEKVIIEKQLSEESCCKGVWKLNLKDADGNPVAGAKVLLKHKGTVIEDPVTDADGNVIVDGLCEGEYAVYVKKNDTQILVYEFSLKCNETLEHAKVVNADCCKGIVKVIIRDKDGTAVVGAKVKLWKDGKLFEEAVTNADGYAVFDNLCKGKYGLSASKDNVNLFEQEFELDCNATKVIEKKLESDNCCLGKIKLILRDENGQPVAGAKVKLYQGDKLVKEATTDANGYVIWEEMCKGSYYMTIEKDGRDKLTQEFTLECNATKVIEKSYGDCCRGILVVYALDADGKPISGATVKVVKGGSIVVKGTTNADGKYVTDNPCAGNYVVYIMKEGFKVLEFEVTVKCKETVTYEKKLTSETECCKGILKVYPQDKDTKAAINGATVNLWKDGKLFKTAKVENGKAVFDGLCVSKYGVSISHDDYKTIEFNYEHECNKTLEFEKLMEKK